MSNSPRSYVNRDLGIYLQVGQHRRDSFARFEVTECEAGGLPGAGKAFDH
jgi:hypothetical protein